MFGEDQIEIHTAYGKKMVVRTLSKQTKDSGVVVAYEESNTLWSVALCGAPSDGLVISLAK